MTWMYFLSTNAPGLNLIACAQDGETQQRSGVMLEYDKYVILMQKV